MRVREGAHLRKELLRDTAALTVLVRRARLLAPRVPKRQRELLLRRLRAARLPADVLNPRIVTEIAIFAERCDIAEELARLDSHLAQFHEQLESDKPVGRTLEFLAQEMDREWNTAGAKRTRPKFPGLWWKPKPDLIGSANNWQTLNSNFQRRGILFVLSAPSGAGKTTLCSALRHKPDFVYAVSCTTRAPRPGEVEGEDYHFLSDETVRSSLGRR